MDLNGIHPFDHWHLIQITLQSPFPGDFLLISGHDSSSKNYLKIFKEEMGKWVEEGDVHAPPSIQPSLTSPRGVAIHSPLLFCSVRCESKSSSLLQFNNT